MSTFLGQIKEIPGISVDRFDNENTNSSVFFLSHCHRDHMVGLNDDFFKELSRTKRYLYCSPISKALLEGMFCLEKLNCIKEMYIDKSNLVSYKTDGSELIYITVTCIPAGHCPGSVMFNFESNGKNILYTGDFRINPKDFPKIKSLHFFNGSRLIPRTFDKIYLDTTFLNPNFFHLPTRQESMLKICEVAKSWLDSNPRNVVVLECSHLYGSEFLYIELSKSLNMKIHVKEKVYQTYKRIMELSSHITLSGYSTRIHACVGKWHSSKLKCQGDVHEKFILTIIPSVLKWEGKDTSVVAEWDEVKEQTYNVCYSTHSSFYELKEFIQYFNASEIHPCVCPEELEDQIWIILKELIKSNINY